MQTTSIAFIGGGNMARSLIGGLLADGCSPLSLSVADPVAEQRTLLHSHFGVHTNADNAAVAAAAEVVVLAVKPQVLQQVAVGLAATVQQRQPLIISVAAGVREPDLRRWLGGEAAVVRVMPNTPALVGSGASALYANIWVSPARRQLAESILRAVGLTVWVDDESLLDAVTALSGSGPAYFFLLMEALEDSAVRLGLPAEQARLLCLQTAFGAAKMALESADGPAVLRARVTSPGGTTERAVTTLQQGDFEALIDRALAAACGRARELGELLGGQS